MSSCFITTFYLGHARVKSYIFIYSLAVFDCGHEVVFELWSFDSLSVVVIIYTFRQSWVCFILYIFWIFHLRVLVISLVPLIGVDGALAFDETWLINVRSQIQIQ